MLGELIHDPEHGWIGKVDWSTQDVWKSGRRCRSRIISLWWGRPLVVPANETRRSTRRASRAMAERR